MKWKNYALWTSLAALAVMIVTDFTDVTAEKAQSYINVLLGILVAAGIVNSPEKGQGFNIKGDDK